MTELPQVLLPPAVRSRAALGLTAAAAAGRFELQVCRVCGAVQYPPRDACHRCLSVLLDWRLQEGSGELISETTVLHSQDAFFRERLPVRVGLVRLASGPTAVVYVHDEVPAAPTPVKVDVRLDKAGQAALVAFPEGGVAESSDAHPAQKRLLREMSCDPRGRKILVTDGAGVVGLALVEALVEAGAEHVWAGYGPCAPAGAVALLKGLAGRHKQVSLLDLDVTSQESVGRAAAGVAAQVDVVVSNAQVSSWPATGRDPGSSAGPGLGARSEGDFDTARRAMDVHYFGLLRLAAEFAPAMRTRAARVGSPEAATMAWVNLLSIYALSSFPEESVVSAAYAAAHSYAQSLRAEMLAVGIKVVNVFPGPVEVDDVAGPDAVALSPRLSPESLAATLVQALCLGVEDVYPGAVAQEWYSVWRANPKVLERELSVLAEPQR